MIADTGATSQNWFVGASYEDHRGNQVDRFLDEGIWESGHEDKYIDLVRTMREGDRIALKSTYTKKLGLPFDNRGQSVSVMAIKATGIIVENLGDGKRVRVDWAHEPTAREWYFYTNRFTVWRVLAGDWKGEGLLAFAFDGQPQDFDRFCNAPFWAERFGTRATRERRFTWTKFYQAIADALLVYRERRADLVAGLRVIAERVDNLGYLAEDHYPDGSSGFIRDIDPFTAMGVFNRGITEANRKAVARELAGFLDVTEPVPATFEGIPILNNLKSWFFPFENKRTPGHIDSLWAVFSAGLKADVFDEAARADFARAFDDANGRIGVAWNLTMGLYWIRPWSFPSLDRNSQTYLTEKLRVPIGHNGPKKRCSSSDYLAVIDALEPRFAEAAYPVHSYPELSLESWRFKPASPLPDNVEDVEEVGDDVAPLEAYGIAEMMREGCFLDEPELKAILERLHTKKNLILQGPPGTGKTWLAKRLAYALIGWRDESKVRAVQFHPNLSYEDFVRGWRPSGDGRLRLSDGVFLEAVAAAAAAPSAPIVVVVEEINRGNPAQIFGEMLTLLEAAKRTPRDALELCYPDADGHRRPVHVPANLYVIGTMNVADRSLALVDMALRRRFAFVTLEPRFGERWCKWVVEEGNVDAALATEIDKRMLVLNTTITGDASLGKHFRVGHSYVTPAERLEPGRTREWFRQVVETEIGPLLEEYWFDAPEEAKKAREQLLQGW